MAKRLLALHSDEQGADMVEYVLIVAAVALPVLAVLLWFWEDIAKWANEQYGKVRSGEGTNPSDL